MKLTDKQIRELKELMKKHIDLEKTELRTNRDDHYCQKIWGELRFKLPYGFHLLKYGTSLYFDARDFINNDIVDRLFKAINIINKASKQPSQKLINELIDHIDFNKLMKISYTKSKLIAFYTVLHSYEISNIKQFNGKLFGRSEIKDFLKKHPQFKVVTNIAIQDSKNIALVSIDEEEYLPIYLTEYIKLFMFLEDVEVIETPDKTVML